MKVFLQGIQATVGAALLTIFLLPVPGAEAQSTPHVVWGKVLNSRMVPPKSESFMFYAYIQSRPADILTHKSVGCGYSEAEGIWYINTGNFKSGWQVGDVLVVELLGFDGRSSIERKLLQRSLTGSGNEYWGEYILEPVPHLADRPLPVELAEFTARIKNRRIELLWKTLSERNNSGFRVERAIENRSDFVPLGFVEGQGTVQKETVYRFVDTPPRASYYRYRLVQIDQDGKTQISNTIEVSGYIPSEFSLLQNYPNPFKAQMHGTTRIPFELHQAGDVTLKIYNLRGRLIKEMTLPSLNPGVHSITWDGRNQLGYPVPAGSYFYELSFGDQVHRKALILIR